MTKIKYIAVPQSIDGLDEVFGGWLVRTPCPEAPDGEFVVLVDVGTAAAAPDFIAALQKEGIGHIDLILLSHIHVDHAGALADVLEAYPTAKAICHEKGLRHLVDPERLWESTKAVMTDLAGMYGKPKPVPADRLVGFSPEELAPLPAETLDFEFPQIEAMSVPGHAPHSMFFSVGGYYFIGEAACCTFEHNDRVYLRAATPPRFEMPVFISSIDKLLSLPQRPAFAGHSAQAYPSAWLLSRSKEQLQRWHDLLQPYAWPKEGETEEAYLERLLNVILKGDPDVGPVGVWSTEKWDSFFHKNSIIGFIDYLRRKEQAAEEMRNK